MIDRPGQMSTAIQLRDRSEHEELAYVMNIAEVFTRSGYFRDIRDQAQAVTKILYGRELGFSPVVSIQGIHIIEGKPSLSANLLATLIKRSGRYDYRIAKWDDTICEIEFRQREGKDWEVVGLASFSMDDARRAGVVRPGGGWAKYPKAMLFARALSAGMRAYAPDVGACPLYVPEELGAEVTEEGQVVSVPDEPKRSTEARQYVRPVAKPDEPLRPVTPEDPITTADLLDGAADEERGTPEPRPPDPPPPSEPTEPLISVKQQGNLHQRFREELPDKLRNSALADQLLRDYLRRYGFTNEKGEGSAAAIPVSKFKTIGAKLMDDARKTQ